MRGKQWICMICTAVLIAALIGMPASAKSSGEIQKEINAYQSELSESEAKSEEINTQIADLQKEVGSLIAEIEDLNLEMESYRDSMSTRIKYFYEESVADSVLDALLGATSFSDFVSRMDYLQSLYDYDSSQLDEFTALITESEDKQDELNENIDELSALLTEQETLQASLKGEISSKESELAAAQEAEAKAAAEAAAKKAAEEAAKAAAKEDEDLVSAAKATVSSSSGKTYSYSNSGGALTKSKGVVYYNGHRETWYSQRVLPGGGLNIPGRHVDENGIIRDGDGYICVASSDYPKGTIVETSLGTGKVYDSGCASGTIDIYTDW